MDMKSQYKIRFILLVFMIIMTANLAGCNNLTKQAKEIYGTEVNEGEITETREILSNSENFLNQTVILEGKITQQCPTGCWFYLEDRSGTIFVDINPSGLSIPPKVGSTATVGGTVIDKNGRIMVVGKGVVF